VLDISWQLQRLPVANGRPLGPADFEYRPLEGGLYLTRPKSSAGWREIPLVDPLRSMIERHLAHVPAGPHGLLFDRGDGRPIDPDQDSAAWRRLLVETEIARDVNQHGLRHTAVDLLYLAGVPEDIIQQIVGQSVLAITRGYRTRGEVQRQRLFSAMDAFSAQFMQIDPGTPQAIAS
jgi:integrase